MSAAALLRDPAMRASTLLPLPIRRSAQVSACQTFRWSLLRLFGAGEAGPVLPWVMLNPSTADGVVDDPTLQRITAFSWLWGFDGLLVVNLFPLRSPHPRVLQDWLLDPQVAGTAIAENRRFVAGSLAGFDAVVVAWGAPGGRLAEAAEAEAEQLLAAVDAGRVGPLDRFCLGHTAGGAPIHPMARGRHRVPAIARPTPFRMGSRRMAA